MKIRIRLSYIMFFVLVASITSMIFVSSFFNTFYDENTYQNLFLEHGTYDRVENADEIMLELIAYLNGESIYINESNPVFKTHIFTEDEIEHMNDVRAIIAGLQYIYFVSFIIFFLIMVGFSYNLFSKYQRTKEFKNKITNFMIKLQKSLIYTCSSILFLFWAFAFFNFNMFFEYFHRVLFEDGTWTFPSSSLSIMLFPKELFYDFFTIVLFNVFIFILLLGFILLFVFLLEKVNNKSKTNEKNNKNEKKSIKKNN